MELTNKEKEWVKDAKRLFRRKPKDLLLYAIDTNLSVSKRGVSSFEYNEPIGDITDCGAMLTDLHEDRDCGRLP
ncbi:MAG: hypothetical protein NUV49_02825 [Patescibacteria group bacterium]|nr:hypothetical protein [Patescibacteria group bacterium]